ncbi:MAG: hypothetical protein K5663_11285 [Clostridiales bacterium]|nr:hypothetical protein [Clostridiales bacterium]
MTTKTLEIDKLRKLLDEAGIPYESVIVPETLEPEIHKKLYGEAGKFRRNQVIYGRNPKEPVLVKFDAIWQCGSYGAAQGLIETYHELGVDSKGNPRVMTAQEAFEIIKADWEKERPEHE